MIFSIFEIYKSRALSSPIISHVTSLLQMAYTWFSPDVTTAMFVYRTIEKTVFWELDSIIMQNLSHNLLLFCTQTWPSPHVIENHLLTYLKHRGISRL